VTQVTTYVGIDAHKKDLFIAMLIGQEKTPVTWQLANEPTAVRRLVRKLEREAPGPVSVFYEAGPCGYALQRQVTTSRVRCEVIAPALIPRKPGERVKTNRRDARKLVELGRAGLLTAVQPPTPEDEAVRDLARARDDAREDLQRCRHRLGKLLLRRGLPYAGRNGPAHTDSGSTASNGRTLPSGPSLTTICWRSSTRRRDCWSSTPGSQRSRTATRIGSRSDGCGVSGGSIR
jgi:transposase